MDFRPLAYEDLAQLARWLAAPHVARWWPEPSDIDSVTAAYGPGIAGEDPTEHFVIELDGAPVGLIQRYRHDNYPEWDRTVGVANAAGIDYLLGEPDLVGRGVGTEAIAAFAADTLVRYPEIDCVVAAPQQANVASWRALEKAGFQRVWAGFLDSDDPGDAGPAFVYALNRSTTLNRSKDGTAERPGSG
jgi:RimJ/RimL family protein N-acetyltransferase